MQNSSEFPLNKTQVCVSQMTVRYSSWLPRSAAQLMNKLRIGEDGKTSELRRLVEDGESQWRNSERTFGFVKLEKTVSVLFLQAA